MATGSIDEVMNRAASAFKVYATIDANLRRQLLHAVADRLLENQEELIALARKETNLEEARLKAELLRTAFQLRNYSDAAASGYTEGKRECITKEGTVIRKMNIPIGPVVIFGASNFPFAYSTAGGDTASALAAGCTVVVKGHPAHRETSVKVAAIIKDCISTFKLPEGIFSHVEGFEKGEELVKHPLTKAVAFTGSYTGGRQLFDWGQQRKEPIPVFAEMGSVNPVYIFPEFDKDVKVMAQKIASSITSSSGQFCTNPGLIIAVRNEFLASFKKVLAQEIRNTSPQKMLHPGIHKNFAENRGKALAQKGITTISVSEKGESLNSGIPTLCSCSAKTFLENPVLHQEVFGPFSLVVDCEDESEMLQVAQNMEGQLTSSIWSDETALPRYKELIAAIRDKCGRIILNGVPTGVEVCDAMHHGGPYPATTDSRFTSVGADAIFRFLRPVTYQGWPSSFNL